VTIVVKYESALPRTDLGSMMDFTPQSSPILTSDGDTVEVFPWPSNKCSEVDTSIALGADGSWS
jgi:hypothetical protein